MTTPTRVFFSSLHCFNYFWFRCRLLLFFAHY